MKELSIEVSIDEFGAIEAETFGFKGKICEKELRDLLSADFVIEEIDKKDDYFKTEEVIVNASETIRRKEL
jgi:hypothetical protein